MDLSQQATVLLAPLAAREPAAVDVPLGAVGLVPAPADADGLVRRRGPVRLRGDGVGDLVVVGDVAAVLPVHRVAGALGRVAAVHDVVEVEVALLLEDLELEPPGRPARGDPHVVGRAAVVIFHEGGPAVGDAQRGGSGAVVLDVGCQRGLGHVVVVVEPVALILGDLSAGPFLAHDQRLNHEGSIGGEPDRATMLEGVGIGVATVDDCTKPILALAFADGHIVFPIDGKGKVVKRAGIKGGGGCLAGRAASSYVPVVSAK